MGGHERCPLSVNGHQLQLWRLLYWVRSIVYSLFAFLRIPGLAFERPGSKESSNDRGLGVESFHGSGSEPGLELDLFFPGSRGGFSSGGPLPRLGRRAGQRSKGRGLTETAKYEETTTAARAQRARFFTEEAPAMLRSTPIARAFRYVRSSRSSTDRQTSTPDLP